jgi:hypothetical protein
MNRAEGEDETAMSGAGRRFREVRDCRKLSELPAAQ